MEVQSLNSGLVIEPSTSAAESASVDPEENESSDESESEDDDSGNENEAASSSDSDSSTGDSNKCPICLLRFKGQAIGFPEVCGHPFCLDCILEWSKNVRTCPNDRRTFDNILVRLDLDGEVIRKIPLAKKAKEVEEIEIVDVTHCEICGSPDREDVLLLCDRCDCGYHLDCLDPPLDSVPLDDWYCSQCDGSQATATPLRPRIPLALRVRRTIERNRQRALQNSGNVGAVRRLARKKRKTRRRKYKRKTTSAAKGVKSKGVKRKRKRRRKTAKKTEVPTPRKRLAEALGLGHDRNSQLDSSCNLSIFGDPNSLDGVGILEDDDDGFINRIQMRHEQSDEPKSLIARLAENRKASKSIYCFGPVASVKPTTRPSTGPVVPNTSSGPVDLLGSILASQSQLKDFGKEPQVPRPPTNQRPNHRVLGAILASQATLTRLGLQDGESNPSGSSRTTGTSSENGNSSSGTNGNATRSDESEQRNATNGCADGDDDPERPPRANKGQNVPEDASDNTDRDEEDVDLYSDIESGDEEPSAANGPVELPPTVEDEERLIDDDEKGLVIDDTRPEADEANTESVEEGSTSSCSGNAPDKEDCQEVGTGHVGESDATPLAAGPVLEQATLMTPTRRFQHDGLPAAAAALSLGPKSGVNRSQARARTNQGPPPLMNDLMKANLVSSLASALKETLTSALAQAQSQADSTAVDVKDVPGGTGGPVDVPNDLDRSEEAREGSSSPKKNLKKKKMVEIFGSDDEEPAAAAASQSVDSSKKDRLSDLEQVSDCEEGELDESEEADRSVDERETRGVGTGAPIPRRIVMMLTPPRDTGTHEWGEEGEIIDKKQKKTKKDKKKKDEAAAPPAAEDPADEILTTAGIGGERKADLSSVTDDVPATFKKLDSNKTRHYRHQGDIKVVEGHQRPEIKSKDEDADGKKSSKRQEMKRYDVRKVIELRSSRTNATNGRSGSRSRSRSPVRKVKEARPRSRDSKKRRRKSSSVSLSPSPEREPKSRDRKKRSRSRSKSKNRSKSNRKRSRSRSGDEDEAKSSKESRKRKKAKHKEKNKDKEKHKSKDSIGDKDRKDRHHHHKESEIEIPSKAVFASGDKIVVSLHFGAQSSSAAAAASGAVGNLSAAPHVKPEKLKKKKVKNEDVPRAEEPPMKRPVKEDTPENHREPTPPPPPASRKKSPAPTTVRKATPPPVVNPSPSGQPAQVPASKTAPVRGGMRGGRLFRPGRRVRTGPRAKPVLIDIENNQEIPLQPEPAGDVIVLSDSEESADQSPETPPLPPTPPPPPSAAPPPPPPPPALKSKNTRIQLKTAGVKFSLTSKALSLKKVSNPLLSLALDEEDAPSEPDDVKKPAKSSDAKEESDKSSPPLPPPPPPPPPPSDNIPGPKSPIFRPPTPPASVPANSASYDPSQPTNTPSTSSTPSMPPSPSPPPPPLPLALPPPPQPPSLVPNFPPPHPGAVLMPPMTSLPPPPLPPTAMLNSTGFVVNPLLSGVFHPYLLTTAPPPCVLTAPPPPLPIKSSAPVTLAPVRTTTTVAGTNRSSGRPMTPPSPTPSEGSDIFGPPSLSPSSPVEAPAPAPVASSGNRNVSRPPASNPSPSKPRGAFDALLAAPSTKTHNTSATNPATSHSSSSSKPVGLKSSGRSSSSRPAGKGAPSSANPGAPAVSATGDTVEEVPSSAVELQVKEKFLKKLNRQERVVEEVRLALKPYYTSKRISKSDYKEILRRCVPKICHTKSGEINPIKIKEMVKGYVKKFRYLHKKQDLSSSSHPH